MPFILAEPPGFTDLPDALITAGSGATGFLFTALKDNAAFGSVVPEVFYTSQKDGDTVPLPVSPVDGYQYQRSELVYVWEIFSTVSGESGVPSASSAEGKIGGAGLLWCEWYVEPNNGKVHSTEVYGTNSLSHWQNTHDGTLAVWTFGLRGRQVRTQATKSSYTDLPASDFNEDNAATQTVLRQLSHNAKLANVQCEVIPVNPSGAPIWQPNTNYAAGQIVQPSGFKASGFWFVAANTGVSGAFEPNWPGVWHLASPINDGSMIWNVAGAGFYNGQQIPFPVSPVDGYLYSSADSITPLLSFISTQAMPFQKKQGVLYTSGNGMLELRKSVSSTQPGNPGQGGTGGGNPPGNPPTRPNPATAWQGTLQNWTPQIAAPAAPTLNSQTGGSFAGATYFVKITYVSASGETTPSAESNRAVAANSLLVVNSPPASGAATGYNVYVGTSIGSEVLQGLGPVPIGTNFVQLTEGAAVDPTGIAPPTVNTTGFVRSPAETNTQPFLSPGSSTTGVGIVNCSVDYFNSGVFSDGTCMVWLLCFRAIPTMAAPGGALFTDMSTDWFSTGYPLRSDFMQDLNENAKFSILRPEIFLNVNVPPGTVVPTPTSPVDGYAYARSELDYLWYFTWTGHNAGLLRDFTIFVDPVTGVLNTRYDSYRTNGSGTLATAVYGQGGQLQYVNMGGPGRGTPQVNVIVVARRKHENELQTPVIVTPGGNPAPPGPTNLIPNGNFDIWPIPSPNVVNFGAADDWGILQNVGTTFFSQDVGIGNSLFSQDVWTKPAGTSLAQRQQVPPPGGTNIASVASSIIPVWPGGTYRYHFIAAAKAQFSNDTILFGFYARIHCLGQTAAGDPDPTTDTSFELLGPNLTIPPGTTSANNPGGSITVSPPSVESFDFTFTTPLAGATSVPTSAGQSILSQTMPENTAYLYVEFLLWDTVSSGTGHQRAAILDNVVLQDLTEGSTNLNQQGSVPTVGSDNAAFTFSSTTTTLSFWWVAFQLAQANGNAINVPAQGSSGSPAKVFTGLTPGATYYVSARWNLNTFQVELRADPTKLVPPLTTTWLSADGYFPIFANFTITLPSTSGGTGGGGGSPGGGGCFTGETKIKTIGKFVPFDDLPPVVLIENERGRFLADHVVHEDMDEEVIPIGEEGAVTLGHNLRWNGEWKRADEIFPNAERRRFRGRLHNLHLRTTDQRAQHYIVEGGYVAHNLFKN